MILGKDIYGISIAGVGGKSQMYDGTKWGCESEIIKVTLHRMHRPPQARSRYLPHAAVRKSPKYGD